MFYTGLYNVLAIIFILIILNRHFVWWIKAILIAYYSVLSYIFIKTKNKIDKQYENILPVPDAYWDKNSGWVDTMSGFYLWPLLAILLFLYYKWFRGAKSSKAKVLIAASLVPAAVIFLFFMFVFAFGYGYRP